MRDQDRDTDPILDLRAVSVIFDGADGPVHAVDQISMRINRGDFVCVVGPSGCGKTTLLHTMAGFLFPSAGEILDEGKPIEEPGWHRGVVFQRPSLYPWLTVQANVEFGPRMRGLPHGQRRELAERYLRMVKLWESRRQFPYELSGGMQQRVAIARVLVNDPHILLMDEPFGALDALTRAHMQEELLEIWRATGKTVVMITHDVEEAVFLATLIHVLTPGPGRIKRSFLPPWSAQGRDRKVKADPEFVAMRQEVIGEIWADE